MAETIWGSIGHGTPGLASRISIPVERASPCVFLEAEINDNEEESRNTDDHDEDEEEQPDENHGETQARSTDHGDTVQSEYTMADMQHILEQQRKLIELLFQNAELNSKDAESLNPKDKFNVTHTKLYSGGVRELETFPGSHRSNFRTHNHLLLGGETDKVRYALDHLGSWVNHPDCPMQKKNMTDLVTCGQDLLTDDHSCIVDLDLFIPKSRKQYGDKDRRQNSSTWASHELMRGYHNPE